MARLYRCYNPPCADSDGIPGHDFVGIEPVCDRCGADQRDPRLGRFVINLKVIHWDPPQPKHPSVGQGIRACDGQLISAGMASGDPLAVNCPACRQIEQFRAALKQAHVRPEDDLHLELNLQPGHLSVSLADCGCGGRK